jgi:hypothetical protein
MITPAEPLAHWLEEPTVQVESWAIFWTILAVLVPTLVRASVNGVVTGCEMIPYVPSVLLAAIFLGARHAVAVAVACALVADWAFMGQDQNFLEACDLFGMGIFLVASALIIASVELPRHVPKKAVCAAPDRIRPTSSSVLKGARPGQAGTERNTPYVLGRKAKLRR